MAESCSYNLKFFPWSRFQVLSLPERDVWLASLKRVIVRFKKNERRLKGGRVERVRQALSAAVCL